MTDTLPGGGSSIIYTRGTHQVLVLATQTDDDHHTITTTSTSTANPSKHPSPAPSPPPPRLEQQDDATEQRLKEGGAKTPVGVVSLLVLEVIHAHTRAIQHSPSPSFSHKHTSTCDRP